MPKIALLVSLKIPDVTALTARNALQRRMGYAGTLKDLRREDFYSLEIEGDEASALALVTKLAEETNYFVNPNKHAFTVCPWGDWPAEKGNGLQTVRLLVTDPADTWGAGTAAALRERTGGQVQSAERGIMWTLSLASDSPAAARQLAEEIAVTRRIDQGLLVNPHFQEWQLL